MLAVTTRSLPLPQRRIFDIRRLPMPATRDIPKLSPVASKTRMRAMHKDERRDAATRRDFSTRMGCAGRSADHARAFRTSDRLGRSAARCERAVSAVSAVNAAGDPTDPFTQPESVDSVSGKVSPRGVRFEKAFCRFRSGWTARWWGYYSERETERVRIEER